MVTLIWAVIRVHWMAGMAVRRVFAQQLLFVINLCILFVNRELLGLIETGNLR